MTEWHDISTAPKDGTPILVFGEGATWYGSDNVSGEGGCAVMRWDEHRWVGFYDGTDPFYGDITNWMPLPDAPA